MTVWQALLAVALGGACGALTRYGLTLLLVHLIYRETFWATLTINLVGCLSIGVVSALFLHHRPHPAWSLVLITGFLGSFTTYSTFTLDALGLLQRGEYALSLAHISIQLFGGLLLCFLGLTLARWLIAST